MHIPNTGKPAALVPLRLAVAIGCEDVLIVRARHVWWSFIPVLQKNTKY